MSALWRVIADVIVAAHFGFLLYLIVGGFLALRWPRTIWLHAAAAGWGTLIVVTRVPCPLTYVQNVFREQGGSAPLRAGFIDAYVKGAVYPARFEVLVQIVVGMIVAASWIWVSRRRRPALDVVRTVRVDDDRG